MLMPAGRVVGDDGVYVSTRQICEDTGIDLELLEAMQRALGLPRVDDPDAPVHLRADAEAAAQAQMFVDVGFTREQLIAVARVLGHGMAQAAEVMRQVVLEAVIEPGATELQIAKAYGELVQRARRSWARSPRACCGCSFVMAWKPRRSALRRGPPDSYRVRAR